jgi:hypothetical protein
MVVDKTSKLIICTEFSKGKKHDFRLFKESKTYIYSNILCATDTSYTWIKRIHSNSILLKKSSKKKLLNKEDNAFNRCVSSIRVFNENVIGSIKRFKIISDKYRNRRKGLINEKRRNYNKPHGE